MSVLFHKTNTCNKYLTPLKENNIVIEVCFSRFPLWQNPTCGFGLAVIGGIDNPTNAGEISIIVKDILPNGPADVRLK